MSNQENTNKIVDPGAATLEATDLAEMVPVLPDPFWPPGVMPRHLTPSDKKDKVVDAAWTEAGVALSWRCADCGTQVDRSSRNPDVCNQCYAKRAQAAALSRRTNEGWMEQAESLGLALYERQPEETDLEWLIWEKYRSHYPLKMPTWSALAEECGVAVATVIKASQRWAFRARMVKWAQCVDDGNQEKRIAAIKEMNERQLGMAQTLNEKLAAAIEGIDPALLRPNEIVNLMKVSTELERRVTTYVDEKVESTAVDTKSQQRPKTKAEDLSEVLGILQSTGVLPGADTKKIVGVEQKTTILVKEDDV